jgi:hypothetical protein
MSDMFRLPEELLVGDGKNVPLKMKYLIFKFKMRNRFMIIHFKFQMLVVVVSQIGFKKWLKYELQPVTQKLKEFSKRDDFFQWVAAGMFGLFTSLLLIIFLIAGR